MCFHDIRSSTIMSHCNMLDTTFIASQLLNYAQNGMFLKAIISDSIFFIQNVKYKGALLTTIEDYLLR